MAGGRGHPLEMNGRWAWPPIEDEWQVGVNSFYIAIKWLLCTCTYLIAALRDNLLVAMHALLLYKLVRHCHLQNPRDLESLGPLVVPSLCSGHYSPGLQGILNHVDPSILVSNLQ